MHILLFAFIVILVVALVVWAIEKLPIPQPFNQLLQGLAILIGAWAIAAEAGMF